MTAVCAREAKYALMRAALRATIALDGRDDEQLALWRARADEARAWLRVAYGDNEQVRPAA